MGNKAMSMERPDIDPVIELVIRFNQALNRQDVDTMMGLMAEDCVFENTAPSPEGARYQGQEAVRAFWEEFFRSSLEPGIEIEEIFAEGERCVMRWVYHWLDTRGEPGHIRGVDIYKIRGAKIAEKLSYVKG
jgi:ketosteroid isomerase-like protein